MADKKKTDTPKVDDVAKPGKSAPSDTAKPIITHRPIMKDPMVNESAVDTISEDSPTEKIIVKTSKSTIQPLSEAKPEEKNEAPAPVEETSDANKQEPKPELKAEVTAPAPEAKPSEPVPATEAEKPDESANEEADDSSTDKPDNEKGKSAAEKSEQEAEAEQAKHDEAIQKLVDSKQYVLPINSVEKRKSKRFVILGILLAVLLGVAWADVALDAGLVSIGGVKPVTHFFSN